MPPGNPPKASIEKLIALAQSDPEVARKLLQKLQTQVLVPHSPGQADVLASSARFGTLCAGRRWGKTRVGAARVLKRARRRQQMVWWIAPTYKIVKRGYREVLRQLPRELLSRPAPQESAFDAGRSVSLQLKSGSRIEFYSAERPEGMLGEGVDFAVLDEAARMPSMVWEQIVRPTLADRQGSALFISTPLGRNWFYQMFQRGQDPLQHKYQAWRFPSMTNPTIPAEEWEELEQTLPRAIYEQEVLAEFVSDAAAVFRLGDDAVKPLAEPVGHIFLGVDLAKYQDFTVFDAVRAVDRLPVARDRFNTVSWVGQRQRLHSFVDKLYEDGADHVTVAVDATGLGDVVYDDLAFEGLDVVPVKFSPQWKQKAVMLLGADLERDAAYITEEQVEEFQSYTYKISETTGRWTFQAPDNGHDDEVAAKLIQHWTMSQIGVPDLKVLSAADEREDHDEVVDGEVIEETLELRPPSAAELLRDDSLWG